MTDPYAELGLSADSDDVTIRKRYLELVRQFPPDHHPEKFNRIRTAYESLKDLETRLRYRLFEAGRTEHLETILGDVTCRSSRRRATLKELLHTSQLTLNPEAIEHLLGEFRTWLQQATVPPPAEPAGSPPVDLHTLVGQFIALRHEVNLQTKSTRALGDQNTESLRELGEALQTLRDWQARQEQARGQSAEEAVLPLLKVLVDLYNSLALARREALRVQETVLPLLPDILDTFTAPETPAGPHDLPPLTLPPLPSWARRLGLFPPDAHALDGWREQAQDTLAGAISEARSRDLDVWDERQDEVAETLMRVDQMLEGLTTGYTMSLQRLERALEQQGLEPIPTVGERFDPERMEVLEAVSGTGRPSGEVVEEVRRGYLWRGRLFRYAQVRVARS